MAIELNVQDDFATILDGFEPITVRRRGSAETIAVPRAWRYSMQTEAAEAGNVGVARKDAVWQFAWDDTVDKPRIGDLVVDATDECWTLLSVSELGAKTRLRCLARNLSIVYGVIDRVDIQQAIWEDSGSGPEIVGWTTLRTAVPARIQPERTIIDIAADPPTSSATYRVLLADDTPLDHNHRLIGPDSSVYQIVEYAQAERIDALPVATVVRQPAVS
jgi:hypothetical protein